MPIITPVDLERIEQKKFDEIDYQVMGQAYKTQNELGNLFDEKIYQKALMHRLTSIFDEVQKEVELKLEFESFQKSYYVDLLINRSAVYEFKTVSELVDSHYMQTLHYLFLCNLGHGKIINFRNSSVEGRFVSTTLTNCDRKQIKYVNDNIDSSNVEYQFIELMKAILSDWGAFLAVTVYYEVLVHILGGSSKVIRPITISIKDREIATQKAHLLDSATAFKITAITNSTESFEKHLQRFLAHTELQSIIWCNMNKHEVSFRMIRKQ